MHGVLCEPFSCALIIVSSDSELAGNVEAIVIAVAGSPLKVVCSEGYRYAEAQY